MLEYKIHPFERAFAFQILRQDHIISKYFNNHGYFLASNGWTITTDISPAIYPNRKIITLRGEDRTKDLRVDRIWDLNSTWERDDMIADVHYALKEFKNHVLWNYHPYGCCRTYWKPCYKLD